MRAVPFLLLFLVFGRILHGQLPADGYIKQLISNRDEKKIATNDSLLSAIYQRLDSAGRVRLFRLFEKHAGSTDPYTAARSLLWKGVIIYRPPYNDPDPHPYMQQGIKRAVESGDDFLMLDCFRIYAEHCRATGRTETALFYYLKSAELMEKPGVGNFNNRKAEIFASVGDLYFKMEEYRQAIPYVMEALSMSGNQGDITTLNTLGLCYQRMARYDSALYWYNKSLAMAKAARDSLWAGIVNGNIGAVYFEQQLDQQALPLLWNDYRNTIRDEPNTAGNTLHRIALILLRQQKTDSALLLARQSLQIVRSGYPVNPFYIRNAYHAVATVYKKTGNADSAFHYSDLYHQLNDSLNQAIARNRSDVVQTRLEFEKTSNRIRALVLEKQSEKTRRNLLLAGMGLLLIAGWFYFRWQRQRNYNKEQLLLHQKQMAEAEARNAAGKLEAFTENIIRSNERIEKLQEQLQQQHLQVNAELHNQSILTENDWLRFRDMFEKANPGFIRRLQSIAPDITTAEIRFAALTRLKLGNKHIASMLGIGADAVRKTKSRLRQRLNITAENGLEDFIATIEPDHNSR